MTTTQKIITAVTVLIMLGFTFSLYVQAAFIVDLTQAWIIC